MTTTQYPTIPSTTTRATTRTTLRRLAVSTVLAGLVASAATTATAALAHAAGVSLDIAGDPVPVLAFAQMTFLGAVLGGLLLAGLNRRSTHARTRFVQVTVALTVLSCIPSVLVPDDAASKVALVALHVVAAALVVPALVRHARS